EAGDGAGAQLLADERLVVDADARRERGPRAVRGQPHQLHRGRRLGGVRRVLVDAEAEAPVVGDEAGVALGHAGLDGLEAGAGQLGGGDGRLGQLVAGAGEGGGDLLQVHRQHLVAQVQRLLQLDDEVQRLQGQFRVAPVPGYGLGVHLPVVQGPADGGEAVLGQPVVGAHGVAAVAGGLGGDEPFVRELGERLADQQPVGPRPQLGGQVRHGVGRGHALTPRAASNCSRVQKLSRARFSGLSISRAGTKPTASFSACTALLPTSGSTTTRRVSGSANSSSITAVMTAFVKPCTGRSVGATRKCMPTSPGSGSYRPTRSTYRGSYRSIRKAGSPSGRPRWAWWCSWAAMRMYSRSTSCSLASCIIQNAALGWVTQRCSSSASRSGSSGRKV